jgi:hypothetical protein
MRARHAQPLYALWAGHPPNGLTAVLGVARLQGGPPAAVFFPLDTPSRTGLGGGHDQADAEWIVIRRPLRGRNDRPVRKGVSKGEEDGPAGGPPAGRISVGHGGPA